MTRPTPPVRPDAAPWRNWPESVPPGPNLRYAPRNLAELVGVAKAASPTHRLRACGTRWSSSAAAKGEEAWIDTSALNAAAGFADVADLWSGDASRLFLVEAGIKIHALAAELWQRGFSIPTLGGSMGQSIAGAIGTGTHGTDLGRPPVSGMVRAIHLVTAGGHEFWLEHPDRPVASIDALRQGYDGWHDSIKVLRDDAPFRAALVSAGRLGVIYSYVLEVEPRYQLRAESGKAHWITAREHLRQAALSGDWEGFMRGRPLPFDESTTLSALEGPCVVVGEDRLSVVWSGTNTPAQFRWTHRAPAGSSAPWTRKRIIDDGRRRWSEYPPGITFFDGRYYLAWTGTRHDHPWIHVIRSTDATGAFWEAHQRFDGTGGRPSAESGTQPQIVAAGGRLCIVWRATQSPGLLRWMSSSDGAQWIDRGVILHPALGRGSTHRPSLSFFEGRYYLAWKDADNSQPYVHVIRSTDDEGVLWEDHVRLDGTAPTRPKAETSGGPTLLAANGELHLFWVGRTQPGKIRSIRTRDGQDWRGKQIVSHPGSIPQSDCSPAVAFHEGRFWVFWTGPGGDRSVYCMRSADQTGTNWEPSSKITVPPGPSTDPADARSIDIAINPESAHDFVWWTIRTEADPDDPPTRVRPGLSYLAQGVLIEKLSQALEPATGAQAGGLVGFFLGLAVFGPLGGIVGAIAGAVGGGAAADSDDVFVAITDLVFDGQLSGAPVVGPSYQVTSGTAAEYDGDYVAMYREFWDAAPRVQYTEIFFDAERTEYLAFVDELRRYFASPGTGKQAGYIAVRFTTACDSFLGMQRWPVTAAVEVALLQDLDPDALARIQHVNTLAQRYDVRFHWGMTRPPQHVSEGSREEAARWREGAARLGVTAGDGFSSAFSAGYQLEPQDVARRSTLLMWGGR
ncbi:MAG: FAD-binding protein [Gemmatimonadales bacterium]